MLLKQKLLGMMKVVVLSCFRMSMTIWVRSRRLGLHGLGPDQGKSPRECLFGNVVETKVVGADESSCFKLFQDVHDNLGEVHAPRTARSGT